MVKKKDPTNNSKSKISNFISNKFRDFNAKLQTSDTTSINKNNKDNKNIITFINLINNANYIALLTFSKNLIIDTIKLCKEKWQKFIANILTSQGKRNTFLMFCLGLCNFVATTPLSILIVLPLTFGSLFYILEKKVKKSLKSQLLIIFAFLFGHFTSIFWWFFVPLTSDFLHLFWLTPFAILGLPFLIAIVFMPFFAIGLFAWRQIFVFNKKIIFSQKTTETAFVLIFILCWFLGDYVRGHFMLGGFPWMLFGHFVPYSFALQSVKFLGIDIYSIFFLALVLVPYLLIFKKQNNILVNFAKIITSCWIANCLIGSLYLMIAPTNKLNVNIFASQANMPAKVYIDNEQASKILNKNAKILSIFSKLSQPTIMLMPEGSINFNLESGNNLTQNLGRLVPNDNSILLAGGIDIHGVAPYNVIYAISNNGNILDMYKKQKLVPFGEYIPLRRFLPRLTRLITGGNFDFSTDGINDLFIFHKNLPIIYPIVCYESIFPTYVKQNIAISRKRLNKDLTEKYTKQINTKTLNDRGEIIVNLTNDAWMKWSFAPYQHFLMTRFLAIYTGLPVIRVSNNGISAFIDNCGRIVTRTKLNKEDLLFVERNRQN